MKSNPGPLAGIRVLDHTTALAGPYCAQILGDLGADVIKVERPDGGDMSRGWGPPFIGKESAYFLGTNRNKRGMTLNLATEAGKVIFTRLLKQVDVLVHNVPRESSRKKLLLDAESCSVLNPQLVWAGISGFGNSGPLAESAGYDILAQAMSGTMHVTGEADDPPIRFPTPLADLTAGIYTALAIVSALFAREKTGKGQAIDTALLDSQVAWLSNLASNYLVAGQAPKKLGNAHPSIVPYQPFPTSDDWIIVAVGSERLWKNFVEVMNLPELKESDKFASNADRLANRHELVSLLAERFREKGSKEWLKKLDSVGIPSSPILTLVDSLNHEHLLARGMVIELEHPTIGLYKALGSPLNLSGTPVTYRRPAPMLGEHNQEILQELGFSAREIETFQSLGTI